MLRSSTGLGALSFLCLFVCLAAPSPARAQCAAELAGSISEARLRAHIEALEGPRADAAGWRSAADYVASELASYGYAVRRDPVAGSENVVASLSGVGAPERVFILGAHFDTVAAAPGADDNASGVAGLLEAARVLAPFRSLASVEFVGFGLEELGLFGSRAHATAHAAAGTDLIGVAIFEMIGYTCAAPGCQTAFGDLPGCLDVTPEGVSTGLHIAVVASRASEALLASFTAAATTHVPALPIVTGVVEGAGGCFTATRRSDHAPFWDIGVRALQLTDTAEFRNRNYHTATDTLATLDLAFATDVTRATLAMIVEQVGCALADRVTRLTLVKEATDPSILVVAWGDVGGASEYVLYADAAKDGPFASMRGSAPSGDPGLIVGAGAEPALFFTLGAASCCGERR